MKKGIIIAIIIILIIAILAVILLKNKIGDNDTLLIEDNTTHTDTKQDEITRYNQSFGLKIGTDSDSRNGNSVKALVSKIMNENKKITNPDDLIILHFESYKGKADSDGSEESTQWVYDCIGDELSTYQIIVDEYTEEGKIKKLTIKWQSGTSSEPDIPDKSDYVTEEDDWEDWTE